MLVLIDKPFVSDFLAETLEKNNYPVVSTPEARELIPDKSLNWVPEKDAAVLVRHKPGTLVYTNSENALDWIDRHAGNGGLSALILRFKDKARFRTLVESFQKGISFRSISLDEIQNLDRVEFPFPFVLKPAVGFFSLGVHIIHTPDDWIKARNEVRKEQLQGVFPESVLNTSTFLLEEYIRGEEYAVDCYFNREGEAVVLNILHHRFASGDDTSDRVYTTSRDIVLNNLRNFEDFLNAMGKAAGIRNFPAHVELRMDGSGKIHPIEVNPLRFGGFCTTADLPGIALGYNVYEHYASQQKPDWESIFRGKEKRLFSIVVLNNNSGIPAEKIRHFQYDLLEKDFASPLDIRRLDIKKYPLFGFLFAETHPGKEEELDRILNSDLKRYITTEPSP